VGAQRWAEYAIEMNVVLPSEISAYGPAEVVCRGAVVRTVPAKDTDQPGVAAGHTPLSPHWQGRTIEPDRQTAQLEGREDTDSKREIAWV
jgi:hypothetical protein